MCVKLNTSRKEEGNLVICNSTDGPRDYHAKWSSQRDTDIYCMISLVQSLSRVPLFATPWTAAQQASLSITNSQSLLKLMSITSVMPSNHLILCRPLLLLPQSFPASSSFPVNHLFTSGSQSIGASASVLQMNIQS